MNSTVLILQNERFYADYLQQVFLELGFVVGGPFCKSYDAQAWLVDHQPDVAVIDAEVQDGGCIKIAEGLHARKVPFVIHSTVLLKDRSIDPIFRRGLFLKKPASQSRVLAAMQEVMGGRTRKVVH